MFRILQGPAGGYLRARSQIENCREVVTFHVPALGNLKINVPLNLLPGCLTSGTLLPTCFLNPYIPRVMHFSSWHGGSSHCLQSSLNTRSCSSSPGLLPSPRQFPDSGAKPSVCAGQGPSGAAQSSLSEHLHPHRRATLRSPATDLLNLQLHLLKSGQPLSSAGSRLPSIQFWTQ